MEGLSYIIVPEFEESHFLPIRCDSRLPQPRKYAKNLDRGTPGLVLKGAILSVSLEVEDEKMLTTGQRMGIPRVVDMPLNRAVLSHHTR
jgi:hypothetical protein